LPYFHSEFEPDNPIELDEFKRRRSESFHEDMELNDYLMEIEYSIQSYGNLKNSHVYEMFSEVMNKMISNIIIGDLHGAVPKSY